MILDSIRMTVRALRVSSRACEIAASRTSAQIFILQQLRMVEKLSVNELAERTLTHQSTVSEILSRLVKDDLVSRAPSKRDARQMEICLTAKGAQVLKKVPRTAQEDLVDAIARMKPNARKLLAGLLNELVTSAGFAQERPPLFFEDRSPGEKRHDRS